MGRLWLDELLFGKEVLDRWDREREGQKDERFLTPGEKKVIEENNFRNEFYKLGNGRLFRIEELPEIIKEKIIQTCSSLEKETLRDYPPQNINLFSGYFDGDFFCQGGVEHGGFLYVEDNKGNWALKSYLKRKKRTVYYD